MDNKKQLAKRLASYTAAAGLGAFGIGQTAEGAIVYTNISDITIGRGDPGVNFDIGDGGTYADFLVLNTSDGGAYGVGTVQFRGIYGDADMTNLAKGNDYYVRSFDPGDLIGPSNANAVDTTGAGVAVNGNFHPTPLFAGIKLDIGGNTHFGWVRLGLNTASASDPNREVTVFDYAYEDAPDTDIAAGAIPEPSSLSLLAAGAGAMAFRRRRKD